MKKLSEMYRATPSSELRKLSSSMPTVPQLSDQEKQENRKKLTVILPHKQNLSFGYYLPHIFIVSQEAWLSETFAGHWISSLHSRTAYW